jgi:effector-binding domain-containing protein
MLDSPEITESPSQPAAVIRITVPRDQIREVMGPGINELRATLAAMGVTPNGPWYTRHLRMDPAVFDFEIGLPVATPVSASGRVQPGELPAARVARTSYRGGYEGLPAAWGELDAWIKDNGHAPERSLWEVYAEGPESGTDPGQWRTELYRPIVAR